MAKSKAGGSRAFIRGRIGSDVYSIGKDGKGSRQQVVRSLAETVANPRTSSQMFNRMIMSTVMQAVSAMSEIIDHSFDGIAKGQPNISEFIRLNYNLIKADAIAHPSSANTFGLVEYQEKGMKVGPYQVSKGAIEKPACLEWLMDRININLTAGTFTVGGLKESLGISGDDFLTVISASDTSGFLFARLHIKSSLADETALTGMELNDLFDVEGNWVPDFNNSANTLRFQNDSFNAALCSGAIISKKVDGAWEHSSCVMVGNSNIRDNADTALPTYPVGTEKFLNGGEL